MWTLLTLAASAADPSCLWETPAEVLGDRSIRLGGQDTRLTLHLEGVQAESRLVIAEVIEDGVVTTDTQAELHTTLSDANLEVLAVLALDADHPMALFEQTLRYGNFGVLPPGAAVHILGADGDSVTVVPSSVYVEEVSFIGAARALPCSALIPREPIYLRGAAEPHEKPDETTTFLMARPFDLSPYLARQDTLRFDPKYAPMWVVLAEERGRDSRYEYHDRYGAIWTGWSSPSNLSAYNFGRGYGLGYGSIGGAGWGTEHYYQCEDPLPLYTKSGVEVGHLKAGGTVRVANLKGKNHVRVDWLSSMLILPDVSSCKEVPHY